MEEAEEEAEEGKREAKARRRKQQYGKGVGSKKSILWSAPELASLRGLAPTFVQLGRRPHGNDSGGGSEGGGGGGGDDEEEEEGDGEDAVAERGTFSTPPTPIDVARRYRASLIGPARSRRRRSDISSNALRDEATTAVAVAAATSAGRKKKSPPQQQQDFSFAVPAAGVLEHADGERGGSGVGNPWAVVDPTVVGWTPGGRRSMTRTATSGIV